MKQEKTILEPGFPCTVYELQKAFEDGWRVSETREPIYIAGLHEIVLEKGATDVENNEDDLVDNSGASDIKPSAEQGAEANVQSTPKRGPKPKGK